MFRQLSIGKFLLVGAAAAMVVAACGGSTGGSPSASPVDVGSGSITGSGATFPKPFYDKAFYDYMARYPQVTVNYGGGGSGQGIKDFQANTVDFGASDVPMGDADVTKAGGAGSLVQIPTTLGVVSIAYNVSGVSTLKLDGPTLASIFLGNIKNWNDPAIAALNSGTTFPNKAINTVHRAEGSGTTYHFTDYLSKVSPEWKDATKSPSKQISWPTKAQQTSATGNAAVAQAITAQDGSIGYVELAYVVQNSMKQAALKNAAGKFVTASVDGATAAASSNTSVSPSNFSITNAPGDTSYPIAAFSWVFLRTSYSDANKGKAIAYLFKWLVTDGQADGKALQYAGLPSSVQTLGLSNLKLIKAAGTAVLSS
jgi:phosphate transport system substrate-binding protein